MTDTTATAPLAPCPRCRATPRDGRLTLVYLAHRLREDVFGLERGLLATAWHLLRRPRVVVDAFLAGDDPRYYSPIKYFLVATALSLLLMPDVPMFDAAVAGMLGRSLFASTELARQWVEEWNTLLYLPLMLLLAVTTRLFFRAHRLNFAEHLVIATYGWAQMVVISTGTFLAVALLKSVGIKGLWLLPLILASTVYWFWYAGQVLRIRGLSDWTRCLVSLPVAWASYLFLLLALVAAAKALFGTISAG